MADQCPWCDYDLAGLDQPIRRCPECGKRPYRRRFRDVCRDSFREQFWPPYTGRKGPRSNSEVILRRSCFLLFASELCIGVVYLLIRFLIN